MIKFSELTDSPQRCRESIRDTGEATARSSISLQQNEWETRCLCLRYKENSSVWIGEYESGPARTDDAGIEVHEVECRCMGQVCAKFILGIKSSSNSAVVIRVVHQADGVEMRGKLRQISRVEDLLCRPHAADTKPRCSSVVGE